MNFWALNVARKTCHVSRIVATVCVVVGREFEGRSGTRNCSNFASSIRSSISPVGTWTSPSSPAQLFIPSRKPQQSSRTNRIGSVERMALGVGTAALVTGAGSGIGRAVSLMLAKKGATVSVVDISESSGLETVRLIEREHANLAERPAGPSALFVKCDVANPEQLFHAFAEHERTYGKLDICVNNAGIGETDKFDADLSSNGDGNWRRVVNINLTAVIDGTRLAIQIMRKTHQPGVIVNIGSASGLYPAFAMPIYSGTKAGVVMFSRSLGFLKREGIRVNVLAPEFVDSELTKSMEVQYLARMGGFIPMDKILEGVLELIQDETKAGYCLWLTNRKGAIYWPSAEEKLLYMIPREKKLGLQSSVKAIPPTIPAEFKKVQIHRLSSNFSSASKIVTMPLKLPVKPGHVLVKNLYAGVNASDVNFSAGRYFIAGKLVLPFDAGFEAVGLVAGIGEGVKVDDLTLGSPVAALTYGGFAEFSQVPFKNVFQIPIAAPEMVAILTSGLTASLALEQAGRMRSGETVLVTAAAGGTGQFAVQLAKLAGNKVVATCGGEDKAKLLRSLGVDRVIDYKKENIKAVLLQEFPNGIDLIYESVGGEMFTTCLNALAQRGRIIVIGMISQYQGEKGWQPGNYPGLAEKILSKSQSVVGFFLNDYAQLWREHIYRLTDLYLRKNLKVTVDPRLFIGVDSVPDAVEYLHSGQSLGKVVVNIAPEPAPTMQARL